MRTGLLLLILGSLLSLGACTKKEEVPAPDLGYDLFPTAIGTWVEYQVDSMWRDDLSNVHDSVSYTVRVRIVDHFTDLEGRACQKIHRYVLDANGDWVVRDVWSSTVNEFAAEMTEENYRRLKLSFPVRASRRWDIHVYGTGATGDTGRDEQLLVSYAEVDAPWSTDLLSFPKTALVKNTVPPNFIETRRFEERYAKGVGMVQKYWEEGSNRVVNNPDGSITLKYTGWRLRMTATAYGVD